MGMDELTFLSIQPDPPDIVKIATTAGTTREDIQSISFALYIGTILDYCRGDYGC